uniref:Uncharacterized protein n=1 Tax=Populus trichocarpa TaxID=3694 RepID=A0A2K1Z616_POPTR
MPQRNVKSWNIIVSAHVKSQNLRQAKAIFDSVPVRFANFYAKLCNLNHGRQLHSYTVKTGSYGSDFVVGSLIDMNYKCRCFKEALGFLSVCADLRNLKIGKIKTMLVLEYESFELLSKFIAKEAVIPDALILVSALGASAFHVQAALGPGTQAHSCAFRIGVEMNIKMMKVGCHMQPMRKFCQ